MFSVEDSPYCDIADTYNKTDDIKVVEKETNGEQSSAEPLSELKVDAIISSECNEKLHSKLADENPNDISFVDFHDVGCSPIQTLAEEKLNQSENPSFVELQDVGCSPISNVMHNESKKEESEEEELSDTVPVPTVNSDCYAAESLSDTIPSKYSISSSIPDFIKKCEKLEVKSSNSPICLENNSELSEDVVFDFNRMDQLIHNQTEVVKSHSKSEIETKDRELLNDSDSMSDIFAYCKNSNKLTPAVKIEKAKSNSVLSGNQFYLPLTLFITFCIDHKS